MPPDPDDVLTVVLPAEVAGRLDRALADALPAFSRARLQALIAAGALSRDGRIVSDPAARAEPGGAYRLAVPPAAPAIPQAQDLPLAVLFEDAHLVVVDKPAGIAAHPAPGTPDGTLVNALLAHCGPSLSGVGGVARPGIVHRLDKDTSGVMVAAKTDAAHRGLAALFAAHAISREYVALVRGAPAPPADTVRARIGRAPFDRQRMAVLRSGGREAVTHYRTLAAFGRGAGAKPLAAEIACTLETGRTHQIRVHLAHRGAPVLGDALYGSAPAVAAVRGAVQAAGLARQALHARVLGFVHPVTREALRLETPPPPDMRALRRALERL